MDPKDSIKQYLQKEGFPFEMKAAKLFQENGFEINSSIYFEDLNTRKSREIDLIATKGVFLQSSTIFINIKFLIECKFSKANPWVLFKSQKTNSFLQKNKAIFRNSSETGKVFLLEIETNEKLLENELFNLSKNLYYGVRCITDNKKSSKNDDRITNDLPYEALMKVSSAVVASQKYIDDFINRGFVSRIEIFFPVIVVDGLLYECFLDDNSEITVNEIDEGFVRLNQPDLSQEKFLIRIISSKYLESIVHKLSVSCNELLSNIEDNIPATISYINNKNKRT